MAWEFYLMCHGRVADVLIGAILNFRYAKKGCVGSQLGLFIAATKDGFCLEIFLAPSMAGLIYTIVQPN